MGRYLATSRHQEVNSIVIGHCCSWYHFLGLYAYLNSQKKRHQEIHLIHEEFHQKKTKIPTELLSKFCEKLEVHESINDIRRIITAKEKTRFNITLITTSNHPAKLLSLTKRANSSEVVQIEEGIGTYGNFKQLVLAKLRETKGSHGKALALSKTILRSIAITLFTSNARKISFLMFSKDGRKTNNDVIIAYKEALQYLSKHTHCTQSNISQLIISSPFSELGMISSQEYTERLKNHFNEISDNPFIKAHPIEEIEKFKNLNMVTDDIPVEILALKNKPHLKEVYCFSSTAIYTCHLLLEITPKRISDLDLFYKKFSPEQRRIIDKCCDII